MRRIVKRVHHHGKNVVNHALAHHRKYLRGAVGFFGIVKLFSFLALSIASYLTLSANIQTNTIQIIGNHITYNEQDIVVFNIQDISDQTITHLSFQMQLYNNNRYIDTYLFIDIEQAQKNIFTLERHGEDIWNFQEQDQESIKALIDTTPLLYLQLPPNQITPENEVILNIHYIAGDLLPLPTEQVGSTGNLEPDSGVPDWSRNGDLEPGTGNESIPFIASWNDDEEIDIIHEDIDTKKNKNLIKDGKTKKNMLWESKDKKIQIKIPKDTKISKKNSEEFDGIILQPKEIDKEIINFDPKENILYAFEVGDPEETIIFKKNNQSQNILIRVYLDMITTEDHIFLHYSQDKTIRKMEGIYPIQKDEEENTYVDIQIDHMTAFVIEKNAYNFFLGDEECSTEIEEITKLNVYACVNGEMISNITIMKFSNINEEDLNKKDWMEFTTPFTWDLPENKEGLFRVFAQYGFDEKTYTTTYDDIIIKKTEIGSSVLSEEIEENGEVDISNKYRKIISEDEKHSVTIDSVGITSMLVVGRSSRNGRIDAPSIVTDGYQATQGENGLDANFTPKKTFLVGPIDASLTLTNEAKFTIELDVSDISIPENPMIYYSYDGSNRSLLDTEATVIQDNGTQTLIFESPHLTLFTVGSITRNNLEFINQTFWDQNPTNTQIIDAFFGTGGNQSAYTVHRNTGCRPTNVVITGSIPTTRSPAGNTIYVLHSGSYDISSITITGCTAIVGSGIVTITKTVGMHAININNNEIILDNIQINGNTQQRSIITIGSNRKNITINDLQIYNNRDAAINIGASNTGANILINNTQIHNNTSTPMQIGQNTSIIVINNTQIYNNSEGIQLNGISGSPIEKITINNSQIYNNHNIGIKAIYTNDLVINNTQIFNNNSHGIEVAYSPNVRIHNIQSFKNNGTQLNSINGSSGRYRGNTIAYPTAGFTNFSIGNYRSALGWNTGTLSSIDPGFLCDIRTNPINGFGTGLYTTPTCNDIGRVTTWTSQPIVKYLYGNNMLSGNYVLRQIQPVRQQGSFVLLSDIPYHGHRFIGEYDDPPSRDINKPVAIFTGTTPPQGTNIQTGSYSGYFNIVSYIYEPNPRDISRWISSPSGESTHSIYDSGLILMYNFDNIHAIGDRTNSIAKDLSPGNNRGTIIGAIWTGNGKQNGAYYFDGSNDLIEIKKNISGTNKLTIAGRFYKHAHADRNNPVSFGNNKDRMEDGGNQLIYRFNGGTGLLTSGTPIFESTELGTGKRVHLTLTADGTNVRTYINGILHKTLTQNGNLDTDGNIYLGARYNNSNNRNGRIDEFRIYNRALTSGEIENIYNNNLAAKSDHREYTVNYTGVQSRQFGTYTYGFTTSYPLIDSDNNIGTATGYLVKNFGCGGTGFSITRNNDNFLTSGFRNQNPNNCDIIYSLYGTGTGGTDRTAYNNFCNNTIVCDYTNTNVIYLTGGTDKLPENMTPHTIYVLASGHYQQNYTVNMYTCNAIIGSTGTITISTSGGIQVSIHMDNNSESTIIDNVRIKDGNETNVAVYNKALCTTINNSTISNYRCITGGGVVYGILGFANNYFKISNSNIYDIDVAQTLPQGVQAYGITIHSGQYVWMENNKIYNNSAPNDRFAYGISIDGNSNKVYMSGNKIFNNQHGTRINNSSYIYDNNSQIYNHRNKQAISITNTNSYITLNNLQIFNNEYGIGTDDIGNKDYITLNNSQIYNNEKDGLLLYRTNYFTINNTHIYNNSGNGLRFAGSNNNNGILNNVFSYNNGGYGIFSYSGNHTRYGLTTTFDNNIGGIGASYGSLSPGNSSTYVSLGRTGGTTTGGCMNCSRITNPRYSGDNRLIDTATYPKCDMRGRNTWRDWTILSDTLGYKYGISLTGQKLPVYRSGTTLTGGALGYTPSEYVAETNKLSPDYTNTTCSCLDNIFRRNNDNFLHSGFRDNNPNSCDIIAALYGESFTGADTTAYTENRSGDRAGQCNIENTNVIYLTGGTGKIDYSMDPNTIYVLASGNYIQTGITNLNTCTAVVGSGQTRTSRIYSSDQFINEAIFKSNFIAYNIFDNIYINGTDDGRGGSHTLNYNIRHNSTHSNTIHNTDLIEGSLRLNSTNYSAIENNRIYSGYGVYMEASNYNILHNNIIANSQSSRGLYIRISENNTVNNLQTFNNTSHGIYFYAAGYNTFNNIQSYNNQGDGIYIIGSSATNNIINNSYIYNNQGDGIEFGRGPTTWNIITNTMIYNNAGYGINIDTDSTDHKYYGNFTLFENSGGNFGGTSGNISSGSASDYPGFGRADGELIETGTLSRDYFANPKNLNNQFLLSFTGYDFADLIGAKPFPILEPIVISYGTGLPTQQQPVLYSSTTLITGGTYDASKFIGGTTTKITGDLEIYSAVGSSSATVTGSSLSPLVTSYAVRGNTDNVYMNIPINTSTTIGFDTSSFGTKRIVGIFYKSPHQDGFMTHFQKEAEYDGCMPGRDNDNFLDDTFRAMNPNDAELICALYGASPGDLTAYTNNRSGRDTTQCSGAAMDVIYTSSIPGTITNNTIYVFAEDTYAISSTINMANCSALISSGDTIFRKSANVDGINITGQHNIVDHIDIDGNNYSTKGIAISNHNNTLHNFDIYKAYANLFIYNNNNSIYKLNIYQDIGADVAFYIGRGKDTIVKDTNVYNNKTNGIRFEEGHEYITFDNIQVYNNNGYGIDLSSVIYSTINNAQIYNNVNHGVILSNASNNAINNTHIYNNSGYGVWINSSSNNNLNNTHIYNNGNYGITIASSSNIKYYGDLTVFGNTNGEVNGTIATGNASDHPGVSRNTGNLITTGTMSRDLITNPATAANIYLLSRSGAFSAIKGFQSAYSGYTTTKYSYGSGIVTQIQPVIYSGTSLIDGGSFSGDLYIGSLTTTKVTGDILGVDYYDSTNSGLFITGTSTAPSITNYSIFGDVVGNFSTTINNGMMIYLDLNTLGTKNIITQLRGANNFATHFQSTADQNIECHANRNNDYFITGAFRDLSPSDEHIICALYGENPNDTTAYTEFRSGNDCELGNMSVAYTGNLSITTLDTNTIYVTTGAVSTGAATINMTNCSAIISNLNTGTIFYSTIQLTNMIYADSVQQIIFDNISINGTGGGLVPVHTQNQNGIFMNETTNTTINNLASYNHSNGGIYGQGVIHTLINNTKIYNNFEGISIYTNATNNIINNVQGYNNYYAIYLNNTTSNNTINNTQTYNNNAGIVLGSDTIENTINNCQVYNNAYIGIWFVSTTTHNNINNTNIFNNGRISNGWGIHLNASANNNKYYGTNNIYDNKVNIGGSVGNLITGSESDYPNIFLTGDINILGNISRDSVTNPFNTNNNYLLARTTPSTGSTMGGEQTSYDHTITNSYSYGTNIPTQTQPVLYSGSTLITGIIFYPNNYIGSSTTRITGELLGLPSYTATSNLTVSGNSLSSLVNKYSIFGNITNNIIGETLGNNTGITLSGGMGTKTIITQLRHPTNYFATHFEENTKKSPDCNPSRDNDYFITGAFRDLNPSDEHIVCALFGANPTDTTAYTLNRSGQSSGCSIESMSVVHYPAGGTASISIPNNTIYILGSGTHTTALGAAFAMGNCSALISSGTAEIKKASAVDGIGMTNVGNVIIDNIKINGNNYGNYGINIQRKSYNSTFNNIDVYQNTNYGIYYRNIDNNFSMSNHNIHNSAIYNNTNIGIYYNLNNTSSSARKTIENNIIDNTKIYNNQSYGIYYNNTTNASNATGSIRNNNINNSHIYNNSSYGIYYYNYANNTAHASIENTTINNTQIYNNNSYGIYYYTAITAPNTGHISGSVINNSRIFNNNNTQIISNDVAYNNSVKYYGTIYISGTTAPFFPTNMSKFITGYATDFPGLGWTDGQIITTPFPNRDLMTNPLNEHNTYLLNRGSGLITQRGRQTSYTGYTPYYSYGTDTLTQIQSVYYSGSTLITGRHFNPNNYIGSDTAKITGELLGLPSYASGYSFTVSGNSISSLVNRYSIFGNITSNIIGETKGANTGITLTSGVGNKTVITQLYHPTDYFATHFEDTIINTPECHASRDNDYFITGAFRALNPSDEHIICALYGENQDDITAYTELRSGQSSNCPMQNMDVVYTGTLPTTWTLTNNTIYVVASGVHTRGGTINMTNCSAIISSGTTELKKTVALHTIIINGKNNVILDNIIFNGNGYGNYGIYVYGNSTNSTFNNIDVFRNTSQGIAYISAISNTIFHNHGIHNSRLYNNTSAGVIYHIDNQSANTQRTITDNTINNSHIYNNFGNGIYYYNYGRSSGEAYIINNTINNTQIYNNSSRGIFIYNQAGTNGTGILENTIINNSQIYNNGDAGIYFYETTSAGGPGYGYSSGHKINNTNIFNNTYNEIQFNPTIKPVTYYGTNYITGNVTRTNQPSFLITGSSSDFPTLGWTDGEIVREPFYNFDYITNPRNTNGDYLLSRTGTLTGQKGYFAAFTGYTTEKISYGSGTKTQTQPVHWIGSTLTATGLFDVDNYIGSDIAKITGELLGIGSTTISSTPTVTGTSTSLLVNRYSVFGDLTSFMIGETLDTGTGIELITGLSINRIITQLRHPTDYFATHFQQDTELRDCSLETYTWNNDNFITGAFRATNPSDCEIIVALYGTGTDGNDLTAYTQDRGSRGGECNRDNMMIERISRGTGTIPEYLDPNTIYVLEDNMPYILEAGNLSDTYGIKMAECSTIIGAKSYPIFYSDEYLDSMITIDGTGYTILDNIAINGNDDGRGNIKDPDPYDYTDRLLNRAGVYVYNNARDHTSNNIESYYNGDGRECDSSEKIHIYNSTLRENVFVGSYYYCNKSRLYNLNIYGHQDDAGLFLGGENNEISYSRIYDNPFIGMSSNYASSNIVHHMKIYNNGIGMYFEGATYNTIYNSEVYNNSSHGISYTISSTNNIIDNLQIYNNDGYGIYYHNSIYNTLNNSQIYNNNGGGYAAYQHTTAGTYNTIHNSQIYNNNSYGVEAYNCNVKIHNSMVYNNERAGLRRFTNSIPSTNLSYYGDVHVFANEGGNIRGTIITGYSTDVPNVSRNDGVLYDDTLDLSRDYFTNPINTIGDYLLTRSGAFTGMRGQQSTYLSTVTEKYSYGSGISAQAQPVYYNGGLFTGGTFDMSKYIGSDITIVTGDLEGISNYATATPTVTGTAFSNPLINSYSIFGDIDAQKIGQTIDTSTGISLTTGLPSNRIVTQLYDGTNYFATHFQKNAILDQTPPSQVILISPLSGSIIPNTTVQLVRSAAIDTGSGLSGYIFQVSTGIGFTTFVTSGSTTNTGHTISSLITGTTYYRRVYATDNAGNTGLRSETWNFKIDIPISCHASRNNDNFIDETFRALSPAPTNENIICALYGEGGGDQTAYTQLRSGYTQASCLNQGMVVVYKNPGTSIIDLSLNQNTIYVLSSGHYIQTGHTTFNSCNTIIGSTGRSILYSETQLNDTFTGGLLYAFNKEYNIIDNIEIDGSGDGQGGSHTGNAYGIMVRGGINTTIHNIKSHSTSALLGGRGVYALSTKKLIITNSEMYNNYGGILFNAEDSIIENTKSYNNRMFGMNSSAGKNNTINNSQFYNNKSDGISITNNQTYYYLNNIQAYNNGDSSNGIGINIDGSGFILNNIQTYNNFIGMRLTNDSLNTTIHNLESYHNKYIGVKNNAGSHITYYGKLKLFDNKDEDWDGTYPTQGTGIYETTLGRSTGTLTITTGIISRDYMTNPISTNQEYMLLRSGEFLTGTYIGLRYQQNNYTGSITEKYSYGSGIYRQIQPVQRSGDIGNGGEIVTRGNYNPNTYIGSTDTVTTTGEVEIDATSITGISSDPLISNFSVFGDINIRKIGQTINTNTGIIFTTGLAINRIITQLFGNPYFATHFQTDIEVISPIIYFTGSTPINGATGYFNNFRPEIEIIQTEFMDVFTYTFNGITYPYYDSGLVLMMNFDKVSALNESDGMIMDFSQYGNHGSGYGGVTRTGNGLRGGAYYFSGVYASITGYIEIPADNSLNFTEAYTLTTRTKPNTLLSYQPIFIRGTTSANDIEAYIENSSSFVLLHNRSNGGNISYVQSRTNPPIGERTHITITFSGTTSTEGEIKLYHNGILLHTGTMQKPLNTNKEWTIGGTKNTSFGSDRYFKGSIDETRIYNRALSSGEIHQMRRSNLSKYDTDKRRFIDDRQCMADDTYTYTGYVSNTFGLSDTTGRRSTISLTGYTPYAPTGYFIGSTGVSAAQVTLSGQFTGHFKLEDRIGTTGRYTTIQLPLVFSGMTYTNNKIENDGNNIRFMATGVDTLGGTNSGAVYISPDIATETGSLGTLHYIKRVDNRTGYYCPAGIYANKPHIYVDIPGRQNPDTYSGIITLDFVP